MLRTDYEFSPLENDTKCKEMTNKIASNYVQKVKLSDMTREHQGYGISVLLPTLQTRSRVTQLEFDSCTIYTKCLRTLALGIGHTSRSNIRELTFNRCHQLTTSKEMMRNLALSFVGNNSPVTKLVFSHTSFSVGSFHILMKMLHHNNTIESLEFWYCKLPSGFIDCLADVCNTRIRNLVIYGNKLSREKCHKLACLLHKAPDYQELKIVVLSTVLNVSMQSVFGRYFKYIFIDTIPSQNNVPFLIMKDGFRFGYFLIEILYPL